MKIYSAQHKQSAPASQPVTNDKKSFEVNQIICGDCIEEMRKMPAKCIDSIITDPPYGLGFMGKEWDTFGSGSLKHLHGDHSFAGNKRLKEKSAFTTRATAAGSYDFSLKGNRGFQKWFTVWARECLRIAKPGAIMLVFGGTRTFHRLTCAIEDAGWEIRDCMMWLYGSGFPKSLNISKAIDKAKGIKKEKVGGGDRKTLNALGNGLKNRCVKCGKPFFSANPCKCPKPEAVTDLAKLWDGYGTALKPAWEPIIVAMKPLDGTFAGNAEKWGVAGLNIDEGRIGTEERTFGGMSKHKPEGAGTFRDDNWEPKDIKPKTVQGRWPANLILDEEAAAMLDEQTGALKSKGHWPDCKVTGFGKFGGGKVEYKGTGPKAQDFGGASRFFKIIGPEPCFLCGYIEEHGNYQVGPGVFLCDECLLQGEALDLPSRFLYCAKAGKKERNLGLDSTLTVKYNITDEIKGKGILCKDVSMVAVELLKKVMSGSETVSFSTDESGESIMVECHKDSLSTILTETSKIIESKILVSLQPSGTKDTTVDAKKSTENGGSPAENAESLREWLLTITNGKSELALGAKRVVLKMLSKINAEENWKGKWVEKKADNRSDTAAGLWVKMNAPQQNFHPT